MKNYTENELIHIGARYNNTKRNYLIINPLQGKHIPVKPSTAMTMFTDFGKILHKKYPDTNLIIGFAETATAVGAGIAHEFNDCNYICTTRELFPENKTIVFLEEHSHAATQYLVTDNLQHYINSTDTIIFVDDELSTGKTMCNILNQLKEKYPELHRKTIVVASLINRLTAENINTMTQNGIICESLLKIPNKNYSENITDLLNKIKPASIPVPNSRNVPFKEITFSFNNTNPRCGTDMDSYHTLCEKTADYLFQNTNMTENITVIGTEECMYPAIIIGQYLETKGYNVLTHSTTRSPIGIINQKNYPIQTGYNIPSFYDTNRTNYIYNNNLHNNDTIIIVTDAKSDTDAYKQAVKTFTDIADCRQLILVNLT